nr:FACT complex subunit SPT16-like [Ipomoea batatas]
MANNRNGNAKAANGKASGAPSTYSINVDTFSKRLKMLYSHWSDYNNELWGSSEVIAIGTPPPSEDLRYLKSSALNMWLVGYEFPDTIMVFMKKQIHFLCSQKKASLLEVVKQSAKDAVGVDVVMHIKAKNDDGTESMDAIFNAIHAQNGHDTPVVGHLAREAPEERVIDEEKKVTHSSLMGDTEKVILEPARIKVKLKAENVDICYPPIFQSGGEFDLKPSASSNDQNLYYDSTSVIICAVGSRYNSYCSNVARTFLMMQTQCKARLMKSSLRPMMQQLVL